MGFGTEDTIFAFEMSHLSKEWIFDSDVREERNIKTPEFFVEKPELYLEELFNILGV